jgi:hypothetical protein
MVRAPAPIIRVQAPRAPSTYRSRKKSHRRKGGGGRALTQSSCIGVAVGGAVLGFVDKTLGASLPTIPILGRAGTIAVAAYFLGKGKGKGLFRDVAIAASAVAGYQMGNTGHVAGLDVAPQVSGIAAQV